MPGAKVVSDDIVGDGKEPGAEAPLVALWRQLRQRLGEDEAGGILGILNCRQPTVAIAVDRVEIAVKERDERLRIGFVAHHLPRAGFLCPSAVPGHGPPPFCAEPSIVARSR